MAYRKYAKKYGKKRTYKKRYYGKKRMFKKANQYKKADGYHLAKLVTNFPLLVDAGGIINDHAYTCINWASTQNDLTVAGLYNGNYMHTFDADQAGTGLNPEMPKLTGLFKQNKVVGFKFKYTPMVY